MDISGKSFRHCCPYKCFQDELEVVTPPTNDEVVAANPGAAAVPAEADVLAAMESSLFEE